MDSSASSQMQNQQNYEALPDGELVILSQSGDPSAFSELMERHQSAVFKIAYSILRDRPEAEDQVQNAFWKAYQHIAQFQREAKFSTWLTRIVVNQCLMHIRQARRARLFYLDEAIRGDDSISLDLRDVRDSPEQELGRDQVSTVLKQEIRRTPPLLRNVFLLRDVYQRPMPEVATQLGISVAAAKSRLLRARAELRKRMSRHAGTIGPATLIV